MTDRETSIDAPQNIVADVPFEALPYNKPRAPFASNLVLTREREDKLNDRATEWFNAHTGSSGWDETSGENWIYEGLTPPATPGGREQQNRRHFVKLAYYEAISKNEWEHRRWAYGKESVFSRHNLNAPLARRISRALAAKAIKAFFETKPYFVCYPVGPSDLPFSESIQKVAESKIDASGGTAALRDAMGNAFDLGTAVLKVAHRRRTSLYKKNDVVLGDAAGAIVLGTDGEYITAKDKWVLMEVAALEQDVATPGPAMEPDTGMGTWMQQEAAALAPKPVKVLKRDGVTQWPQDAQWISGSFARTVTHYSGPEISRIYYRNFLANWDAPTLQEAECCIHMYEVSPSELAAMFTDAKGTQILQSIEMLRSVAALDPVTVSETDGSAQPGSTKIKVQEFWMRCDADGDGVTEDVCFVRVNTGGEWVPLFYDYVQNVTDTKERPFIPVVPVRKDGSWVGIGAIEMFEKHQEAVDLMLNRWAFAVSGSGNITIYDPEAFEQVDGEAPDLELNNGATLKLRHGKMPENSVKRIYLEDNIGDKWLEIFQTFLQMAMNESGVQHANDGAVAGMESTKLATGIRNVERSGNENFGVFLSCLEDGVQRAIRAFVQTLYARIETKEVARILENKVPTAFTVEARDVEGMDFDVSVLLSRYRSEQMLESVRAVLPDCIGYFSLPIIAQVRLAPLFHQLLKGAQIENPEEIISPAMEYSPEETAMSAQFAATLPPEIQQRLAPMMSLAMNIVQMPQPGGSEQPQQLAA